MLLWVPRPQSLSSYFVSPDSETVFCGFSDRRTGIPPGEIQRAWGTRCVFSVGMNIKMPDKQQDTSATATAISHGAGNDQHVIRRSDLSSAEAITLQAPARPSVRSGPVRASRSLPGSGMP